MNFIFQYEFNLEGVIKNLARAEWSSSSHRQLAINNVRYSTWNGSTFFFPFHKQVKVTFDMVRFDLAVSLFCFVFCFFFWAQNYKRLSARVDSMRLTEVNRKNLYLWRSGDLCLQSTIHKFHFIVLIKSLFEWKSQDEN